MNQTFLYSAPFAESLNEVHVVEGFLQIHIRPRPRWLPNFAWRWLLGKFIYLAKFKESRCP